MIVNPSEYIKNQFFTQKFDEKFIVVSDAHIATSCDFEKISIAEPVGQILALTKKYKHVVVVLDRLNWDSLYRLYKYSLPVTVINLNSGYT
jgi:hypothetical protein